MSRPTVLPRSTTLRWSARLAALLLAGTALAAVTGATAPASASDGLAFEGTGAGPIPDGGGSCPNPGAPRDLSFEVAGIPAGAALSDVRVANLRITHSYVGDVTATLIAPDASQVVLFGRTGAVTAGGNGDSSNLVGPYRFTDRAPGVGWWKAALDAADTGSTVPEGYYRASTTGGTATSGAGASITGAFAALADANGTWTLRVTDSCNFDTGSVVGASLQFEIASLRCTSVAEAVTTATDAYAATEGEVTTTFNSQVEAQGVFDDAQLIRTARQETVTAAKAAGATATTTAQQAHAAKDAAADTAITAGATAAASTVALARADAAVAKAAAAVAKAKGAKKKAATKALKKAKAAQKRAATAAKAAGAALTKAKADLVLARQAATAADQARQVATLALADARDGLDVANDDLAGAQQARAAADQALALAQDHLAAALAALQHAQDDLFDCEQE